MRNLSLAVLTIGVIAAVAAAPASAIDRALGTSVQANIVAMAVDLTPSYAGVKMEGTNGTGADGAVNRYRNGRVKPLLPLSGKASETGSAAATGTAAQATQAGGPR